MMTHQSLSRSQETGPSCSSGDIFLHHQLFVRRQRAARGTRLFTFVRIQRKNFVLTQKDVSGQEVLHHAVQDVGLELLLLRPGGALRRRLGQGGTVIEETEDEEAEDEETEDEEAEDEETEEEETEGEETEGEEIGDEDEAAGDEEPEDELVGPHLQQQVDDGRLLAGRRHAQVVHDQDPHEVKDVLLGRVVG